jgi:hypothetical protein
MPELAEHERIWFTTPDIETERQFIDEYILDAVERMDAHEACEKFIFVRAGHDPSLDEGAVIVEFYGEPETIIDQETERWESLVSDGPLSEWERQDVAVPDVLAEHYGEQGVVLHEELRHLATQMAPLALSAFESPPDAVDEYPEEPEGDVGWYRLLHILCNHQGYELDREREANLKNLEAFLDVKAQTDGVDTAQETIDEYIERLEQVREDVEQHREQEQ